MTTASDKRADGGANIVMRHYNIMPTHKELPPIKPKAKYDLPPRPVSAQLVMWIVVAIVVTFALALYLFL